VSTDVSEEYIVSIFRVKKISRARNQHKSSKAFHLLSRWFLAQFIFLTLKMEATSSSQTSVGTQWTAWRYILEDGTLHNLRSCILKD
jgi:hypothetical protein